MASSRIGVGIIGANPERGWAATAHIPALRMLPEYEIRALSTSRQESADKAGAVFGVEQVFDNHQQLVALPEVDLVVISVKVPSHFELVTAALDAGKMVFCEWPLGADLAQAEALTAHAGRLGTRTAVGLQARGAPAINYVRDLVQDGFVGEVLSTTLVVSAMIGGTIDAANAYLVDEGNAANLLTVTLGHCADTMAYCLGEFEELSATLATRRPTVTVVQTGAVIPRTSPDQIAIIGRLTSGATAAVHVRGGLGNGADFRWQINGTAGDLNVDVIGGSPGVGLTTVTGARTGQAMAAMAVPASYGDASLTAPAALNVGALYRQLAADIRDDTHIGADFADAVTRHRLIAAIAESSATGRRQSLG
jgi:predicted dehydrogenase